MARKHFDNYFNQISKQYTQLQQTMEDISEEVSSGMFDPSRLEQIKQTIKPVKDTYEMLNYIRYLLDMPARKEKQPRYAKQNRKLIQQSGRNTADDVLKRNKDALSKMNTR